MADSAVKIPFTEAAAPSTPASGKVVVYAKADGLMYSKDDAGVETLMSSGGTGNVAADTIWDAAGDLLVGTGANTGARLAIGATAGMNLQSNGTTAVWALPKFYGCRITEATAQSISDNTTAVAMTSNDAEVFDTHGYHNTGSDTSRLTIPAGLGGYYYVFGEVNFASDTTAGYGLATIRVDGTTNVANSRVPRLGVALSSLIQVSTVVALTAGQYVELMVAQQAGNALDCTLIAFGCYLIGV
jgi:hypothetical protein